MPKDNKTGKEQSRMTVMMFQLEGSDETLQEGFRTITHAINRMINPSRALPVAPVKALPPVKNGDAPETQVLDSEPIQSDDESPAAESKPAKASKSSPRLPKVLELDLKAGTVPLREYLEQKNPTTDNRKYLLIAAWLKENLSVDEVTTDHIYTCYRHMGWTSQKDIGAPLRSMKRQNGWFNKGQRGAYTINHIGLDVANRTSGE